MNRLHFFNKKIQLLYITKFNYNHIHKIPNLNNIKLNLNAKENTEMLSALVALKLIANKQPLLQKETLKNKKYSKATLIGCYSNLLKDDLNIFFDKLVHIYLPRIQSFNGILNKTNCLYNLNIEDLSIFTELENEFENFISLKNLKVDFTFSQSNALEHLFFFKIYNINVSN